MLYTRDDGRALIGPWIANKYKGERRHPARQDCLRPGCAGRGQGQMNENGMTEILYEGINAGEKDYSAW
jgi:branched-chain amino acid transport system substrate-binding protein